MTRLVTVREHGHLYRGAVSAPAADALAPGDFDALKSLLLEQPDDEESDVPKLLRLCSHRGKESLQVRHYVGVIELPSGTQIEIVPKVSDDETDGRALLLRMLRATGGVPPVTGAQASLRPVRLPFLEHVIGEFLAGVNHLLKRGIASGYVKEEANRAFLKGRLLVSQHLRHNVVRADRFYCAHDRLLFDRAENRLIRTGLDAALGATRSQEHRRLARELQFAFEDVPPSTNVPADFSACEKDRNLSHYASALQWARLLLLQRVPLNGQGAARIRALLFPMQALFESYVEVGLRKLFRPPQRVRPQASGQHLVSHEGKRWFQLRPDFLVLGGLKAECILDAKWKRLDTSQGSEEKRYGISQSDLYQLFAYGNKYLAERENKVLCLVYPLTHQFKAPLPRFHFDVGHTLYALPFDMERCELVGGAQLLEQVQ